MCPCGRNENGDRYLKCSSGSCRECARPADHLIECEREKDVKAEKDVTFKWLRPIKIGTRNEEEWAWDRMPYDEFKKLLTSYYSDTYRLHNWVYKNQQHARLECRQRLQPGDVRGSAKVRVSIPSQNGSTHRRLKELAPVRAVFNKRVGSCPRV